MGDNMKKIYITLIVLCLAIAGYGQEVIYEYDALNRVEKAIYNNGTEVTYKYDALGNRIRRVVKKASLSVSPIKLTLEAKANSNAKFNIQAKNAVSWSISNNANWLSLNKKSGKGNAEITVTAQENTTNSQRRATFIIKSAGLEDKQVTVIQKKAENHIPIANAGTSQMVQSGALVTLDGSASSDANGDDLTYKWTAPNGIVLSDATAVQPTFTAPSVTIATYYTFTLVVNDGKVDSEPATVVVTVSSSIVHVTGVSLNKTSENIFIGDTKQLEASVLPSNASNKFVTWSSSNIHVATVNKNGLVTATGVGSAIITATTADGGKKATCNISVKTNIPIANAGTPQAVQSGTLVTLDGSASTDADGDDLTYKWTAPNDIVLSDATAVQPTFTAPSVTTATDYTFTLVVNDGKVDSQPATVVVTVSSSIVHVTGISLNKTSENILIGDTKQLEASVLPSNASNKFVTWSSSNIHVATVNKNGLVTATGVGSAIITATTADGGKKATCNISVKTNIPIANAGTPQTVKGGQIVTLDGSKSRVAKGKTISYKWTSPAGISLSDVTSVSPTFKAPDVHNTNNYIFTLVVNDGTVNSKPSSVSIIVEPADDDNDGIINSEDKYPNTPVGARVDDEGGVIFDGDIFNIKAISPSCPEMPQGKIVIENTSQYKFTSLLEDNEKTIDANSTVTFDNLLSGNYSVSFISTLKLGKDIEGFIVNVPKPKMFKAKQTKSLSEKQVALFKVSGSTEYLVQVNQQKQVFNFADEEEHILSVPLEKGKSLVNIAPASKCKGEAFSKLIEMKDQITVYPTITENLIYIENISDDNVNISVVAVDGRVVTTKQKKVSSGKCILNISELQKGLYILNIKGVSNMQTIRITKK